MTHRNASIAFLVFLLAPLVAFSANLMLEDESAHRPQIISDAIHGPIVAGDLEASLTALERMQRDEQNPNGTWDYLTGLTLARTGEKAKAMERLLIVENDFPNGPWLAKARFVRADLLGDMGRHEEAQALLDESASFLRSEARRDELAMACFAVVSNLTAEGENIVRDSNLPMRLQAAQVVLDEILALDASQSVELRAWQDKASIGTRMGRFDIVQAALEKWIRLGEDAGLEPAKVYEARLSLAEALVKQNRAHLAAPQFELLAIDLETITDRALLARFAISHAAVYRAQGWPVKTDLERHLKATHILGEFIEQFPEQPGRSQAAFDIGQIHEHLGRVSDAVLAWEEFLAMPTPDGNSTKDELELDQSLRMTATMRIGTALAGAGKFEEAIEAFSTYTQRYPSGPDWSTAQSAIMRAAYDIGDALFTKKQFPGARAAWTQFLSDYPLSTLGAEVSFQLAESYIQEAQQVDANFDSDTSVSLLQEGLIALDLVAKKNAGSDIASRSLYRRGIVQETMGHDLTGAIDSFRRCDFGVKSYDALMRLAQILEESLEIRTKETVRSNETPTIEITTRNLDEIRVELYKLDLEDYFRRHRTHRSIEDLDLDLIQADRSFDYVPTVTTPHEQTQTDVELPIEKPGVWVVTAVSGKFRATTLVLVSDMDLIIESTDTEALIFAQDMLKEEGIDGARLVLNLGPAPGATDGTVLETVTDANGLAHVVFPHPSSQLSVLAIHGPNRASENLDLANGTSRSFQQTLGSDATGNAGYVYTERSTYRPGERVHWRAVIRNTDDLGAYTFTPGKEYDFSVLDNNGRTLVTSTMELGDMGTLHGDLELSSEAGFGTYTISIVDPQLDQVHYSRSFKVTEFRLPKARLTVATSAPVILQGQGLSVEVRADYSHGAPISGATIRLTTTGAGDGMTFESETDREGLAHFTIPASAADREGVMELSFALTGEVNAYASAQVFVSGSSFNASLSTGRNTYLANEAFGVNLTTAGPDGTPLPQSMDLRVLKQRRDDSGRVVEDLVQEIQVRTDALGQARTELRLTDGGAFSIRAEGIDSLGNPVATSVAIFISDDADDVRLRFLNEESLFEVGERATMRLHNRTSAKLALVIVEGKGIAERQVRRLEAGENLIDLDLKPHHFPGVSVSVSLMDGHRFHRVTQQLEVERGLRVKVTPATDDLRPGAPLEVTIETVDGLGRPVAAEFSLAMVDEGFFDLYPDASGQIADAFQGATRQLGKLRGASTCGFAYEGVTAMISSAVLAEAERLELVAKIKDRNADARGFLEALGYAETAPSAGANSDWFIGRAQGDNDMGVPQIVSITGLGGGAGGKFGGRAGGMRGKGLNAMRLSIEIHMALATATRYWLPDGKTDASGKATLTIPMPDQGGAWRFTSKAVGAGTLVGQNTATVTTSSPFLVELLGPQAVRTGDTFELLGRVHYTGTEPATAFLRLEIDGVLGTETREQSVSMDAGSSRTVSLGSFTCGEDAGLLRLALKATLDMGADSHEDEDGEMASALKLMEVRPFGISLVDVQGGSLVGPKNISLSFPGSSSTKNVTLDVYVSGGVSQELIAAGLGQSAFGFMPKASSGNRGDEAGELLGTLAILEWLREANPGATELDALSARARSLVASLTASQSTSGDWGWNSTRGGSLFKSTPNMRALSTTPNGRLETTVLALIALDRASNSVHVSNATLQATTNSVAEMFRSLSGNDWELKAMALHALSTVGAADFADVNRLYRDRTNLSQAALAHLVLALDELGRDSMAAELAALLEQMATQEGRLALWSPAAGPIANKSWNQDPAAMSALSLWALTRSLPKSALLGRGAEGVLSQAPWRNGQAKGFAMVALTGYGAKVLANRGSFDVDVRFADGTSTRIHVPTGVPGGAAHFAIPELGKDEPVSVTLSLVDNGRGGKADFAPSFHARLSGFAQPRIGTSRSYLVPTIEAATPYFEGAPLKVGFSILNRAEHEMPSWENLVENLPKGQRCKVSFVTGHLALPPFELGNPQNLELEFPLAPGVVIVPGTLTGTVIAYRHIPGGMLFTFPPGNGYGSLEFEMMATDQGSYRVPPMTLRSVTAPGRFAIGDASLFTVLAEGAVSPDEYRVTPDELASFGTALFSKGDFDGALPPLTRLFEQYDGRLMRSSQAALAEMLLELAIHFNQTEGTVTYFENLKEYNPNLYLTLEQVLAIGRAYRDLGEYERASTMFMATIAETFNSDMRVAGVLEGQESFAPMSLMLDRLWREYPDLPMVVSTRLSHADTLMKAAETAHLDADLRRVGRDRASLLVESILVLREFMVLYPDHALASDAGLNLVSAYLELEDYEHVAELAGRLAKRFTEPVIRDDFRYTRAVASWFEDRPEDAKDLLLGIADAVYVDDRGRESKSINHDLALYLLGQIHHAAGQLDLATGYYGRVKDSFSDAGELFLDLESTRLELDEVTEVLPGARVSLPLGFKGVDQIELLLYPVDLMTLYLREGDLESVAQVNLAGIAPVLQRTYDLSPELGLALDHTDLELNDLETGAYLAMVRAEGLFASGLVLVTDLELLVREDARQGQIRAQVTRRDEDGYLEGVDIRVVGSGDGAFKSGKTDKRGLFVTSGVHGNATVIARLGEREYAFHRGDEFLGQQQSRTNAFQSFDKMPSGSESFFGNVLKFNFDEQQSRQQELQVNMKRKSKGVQVNTIP